MNDGILIINKPKDYTSHDVVAKCRKILQTKKIGHTGTLDPMATGVLVLCVGSATKLVDYLTADDKIYDVEMQFGIKTDTGDITGKIIEKSEIKPHNVDEDVINSFIGEQIQIPPMYSAIKKNGVKLYELARQGKEIEREARKINISKIENVNLHKNKLAFRVHCSKGTYIRVLCEDVAQKLQTVGTMTMLNRIKSGNFDLTQAVNIENVGPEKIIPIEKIISNHIVIEKNNVQKLLNGIVLNVDFNNGLYNIYCSDKFVGIGEVTNKKLKRKIIVESL